MSIRVAHITTIDMSLRYLLQNQIRNLQHAGFDVVGVSASGPFVSQLEAAGIRHFAVPMVRKMAPISDLRALIKLYQLFRREHFTIVHTHTPKPGLLGQLAARMANVPIIVNTLHGFYFHDNMHPVWRSFYITLEKLAARCSDIILSQNSEDIATALDERICKPEKIRFLGNGIDIQRFDPERVGADKVLRTRMELGIPEGVPVVGFVGRMVAEKGVLDLFSAARTVLESCPKAHFLIVGPVDHAKADAVTPENAENLGIQDACTFTGQREDMPELYALMDVFVLPSHREGFPRAPMEASAMKVPCVVTNIRGCREAVFHGQNGYLVPLGDPETLAKAISYLISHPCVAEDMGQVGRHIAVSQFDEELVFDRVKAEYSRLLEEKSIKADSQQLTSISGES